MVLIAIFESRTGTSVWRAMHACLVSLAMKVIGFANLIKPSQHLDYRPL
jgi:hypothetical protein